MWTTLTLTTADNVANIAFKGRGSVFIDGTFGGGAVEVRPVVIEADGTRSTSVGFIDQAIDGATIKSLDAPSGHYQLTLAGSAAGEVTVYLHNQIEVGIGL